MQEVYRITRQAAQSDASVLLLGETGTGKELIAMALHRLSHRRMGPMIRVNCGALSESLLESELFGHVRGSFTGAVENRAGRFEAADGGTIFLDEINSTSLTLQVKLLRVLQEREFERVGDTATNQVDVRVVAASNRNLYDEVNSGRFREDLYWRLNVIPIDIPPLRERREDIPQLVDYFLKYYGEVNNRTIASIDPIAIEAMKNYDWPGNVRELQNYVERAVVMAQDDELTLDVLPKAILNPSPSKNSQLGGDLSEMIQKVVQAGISNVDFGNGKLHSEIVRKIEKELIVQVMQDCDHIQIKAAAKLGINRNTLNKKLKEFGLNDALSRSSE